jgi:hypothetical protein
MSYLLLHTLLHLRTILKDQQQLYHDILHFADNDIQLSVGYGTLESSKRDNSQDPPSKLKTQVIIISLQASFLPMQMFVCEFACAKRLKLNQEARFGWISRFEAL